MHGRLHLRPGLSEGGTRSQGGSLRPLSPLYPVCGDTAATAIPSPLPL